MSGEQTDHLLTKKCSKCQEYKSLDEFHKDKSSKDGHFCYCKVCKHNIAKIYYDLHTEAVIERSYNWRKNNPEKKRLQANTWNRANPEGARKRAKEWAKNNPLKVKVNTQARRARELNATGFTTDQQLADRMAYYGFQCIYCSGPFEHVDHFVPLVRGGSNWPANLVPSCSDCNWSKNGRDPWEFIRSLG